MGWDNYESAQGKNENIKKLQVFKCLIFLLHNFSLVTRIEEVNSFLCYNL